MVFFSFFSFCNIELILSSYPFRDILLNPPQPYQHAAYDILKSLNLTKEKLLNSSFTSDFEFHTEIQSLFSRLRDGHTQYTPPLCYSLFSLVLPFPLSSTLEQTSDSLLLEQVIRIGKVFQYVFILDRLIIYDITTFLLVSASISVYQRPIFRACWL